MNLVWPYSNVVRDYFELQGTSATWSRHRSFVGDALLYEFPNPSRYS
jgi:hypothetical protein